MPCFSITACIALTVCLPSQVHGVVYVVDSADQARLAESKEELDKTLEHPMIVGKPLLVYVMGPPRHRKHKYFSNGSKT